jgi:DNA-nicking Smr family endonuclease
MARKKPGRSEKDASGPVITRSGYREDAAPVRPFADALAGLRKQVAKAKPVAPPPPAPPVQVAPPRILSDDELLELALAGVQPLADRSPQRVAPPAPQQPVAVVSPLAAVPVAAAVVPRFAAEEDQDPDWWAGDVDPALLWSLDVGGSRFERTVDLQLLERAKVAAALEGALASAARQRLGCLRIVHGGRVDASERPQRLGQAIRELLRGGLRKFVHGYMRAQPEDGGGAALYVWVRQSL